MPSQTLGASPAHTPRCDIAAEHLLEGLGRGTLAYSIDLCVCSYASTTLFHYCGFVVSLVIRSMSPPTLFFAIFLNFVLSQTFSCEVVV